MIRYVACITSYTDGNSEEPIRMSIVVSDISKPKTPILFSRDWWTKDMYLDDMLDEIDATIGDLNLKYRDLTRIHIRGLAPLHKTATGYSSNYLTKNNMQQLMKDDPEQFE